MITQIRNVTLVTVLSLGIAGAGAAQTPAGPPAASPSHVASTGALDGLVAADLARQDADRQAIRDLLRRSDVRDGLSDVARRVLDACPVRTGVAPERLAAIAGCEVLEVLRVLPALELAELVQWTGTGWRLMPPPKPARTG